MNSKGWNLRSIFIAGLLTSIFRSIQRQRLRCCSGTGLLCLLLIALSPVVEAANMPSIAVYPPLVAPGGAALNNAKFDIGEITRRLEEALRATRRFSVFERSGEVLKSSLMEEGDLSLSSLARSDAVEYGKLNNVRLIIQPIVVEFQFGPSFEPVSGQIGMYHRSDNGWISLTCKVLDTTSGQIKYQATISEGFKREPVLVDGKVGGPGTSDWTELAGMIGERSAAAIVDAVFPIMVIQYQNNQLFLNRGEGGGIREGDVLDLYSVGEPLIDPVTKENLGGAEFLIGKVKITRMAPKFSVAESMGELESEPKQGDIVR